eukprot:s1406_g3.t1
MYTHSNSGAYCRLWLNTARRRGKVPAWGGLMQIVTFFVLFAMRPSYAKRAPPELPLCAEVVALVKGMLKINPALEAMKKGVGWISALLLGFFVLEFLWWAACTYTLCLFSHQLQARTGRRNRVPQEHWEGDQQAPSCKPSFWAELHSAGSERHGKAEAPARFGHGS